MQVEPQNLVYRRPEAAAALDISLRALDEMIARGDVPVLRLGRRVLIPRKALLDWLEEKTTVGAAGQ